jgi:FkbM family methyltransferase
MMQESLDYTTQRLTLCHPGAAWRPVCCAVADRDGAPMEITFADPLEGTTSIARSRGERRRRVEVRCLDGLITEPEVLLIKCDIEGFGGHALAGGREVLKRTLFVVTETHGPEETALMGRVLFECGFVPFQLSSRSLWWRRSS